MAQRRAADQVQLALGSSGAAPGTGRQQLCTAAPFGEPKSCPDLQSTVLNQWVEKNEEHCVYEKGDGVVK